MVIGNASKNVDTNKMEWQLGGANLMNKYNNMKKLDSDDESEGEIDPEEYIKSEPEFERNPLKILASRSEVARHKSKKSYATSLAEKGDLGSKNSNCDLGKYL